MSFSVKQGPPYTKLVSTKFFTHIKDDKKTTKRKIYIYQSIESITYLSSKFDET